MKKHFMISIMALLFCVSFASLAFAEREISISNACAFPVVVSLSHERIDAPFNLDEIASGDAVSVTIADEHGWTITVLDEVEGGFEKNDFSFAGGKQFIIVESGTIQVSKN